MRDGQRYGLAVALAMAACGPSQVAATASSASSATSSVTTAAPVVEIAPAPAPAPPPPPAATGDRVLLVVGGLAAARDDIATAELAAGYCDGTIAVVAAARPAGDARFQCAAPNVIPELHDFLPQAKAKLIVTDLDHVTNQWKALTVDGVSFFARPHDYALVAGGVDFQPHLTHFIMTGVTAITRATGVACQLHGVEWLTANLRPAFAGADYVHISNEVSFKPDCQYPGSGTFQFCTKQHDMQALLDLHANVVELTGNHMRDFGDDPFVQTLAWYKDHKMQTSGGGGSPEAANEPVILPLADGKRLGIVGFNEACPLNECAKKANEVGANAYDAAKARADIARMRDELHADFVMVTVQFREWDSPEPTSSQAAIAHELVDAGADLVYGSQAHQLQRVEFYKGHPIFHGLGNLLFDQIHRIGVRQGFFLHHYFFGGRLVQSVPVFTYMSDERQPTLATAKQAADMKAIIFQDALLYR